MRPGKPIIEARDGKFLRSLKTWGGQVVESLDGRSGDGLGLGVHGRAASTFKRPHPFQLVRWATGSETELSWKVRGGAVTIDGVRCIPADVGALPGDSLLAFSPITGDTSGDFTVYAHVDSDDGVITYDVDSALGAGEANVFAVADYEAAPPRIVQRVWTELAWSTIPTYGVTQWLDSFAGGSTVEWMDTAYGTWPDTNTEVLATCADDSDGSGADYHHVLVKKPGVYVTSLFFSCDDTDNTGQSMKMWIRKNDTDDIGMVLTWQNYAGLGSSGYTMEWTQSLVEYHKIEADTVLGVKMNSAGGTSGEAIFNIAYVHPLPSSTTTTTTTA